MITLPARINPRLTAALVSAVMASGALAACGGGDDEGDGTATPAPTTTTQATTTEPATTETTTQATADGEAVFAANCASCHTLKAADASGQVGPNLDDLKPDAARVEAQVKTGGNGMPPFADVLSAAEITSVADYVASNAGK